MDLDRYEAEALARLHGPHIKVPPFPAVALELQRMVADQRTGTSRLRQVVGADAALAASVIACAASAAYGATRPTLEAAIARIGSDELVRLALTAGVAATTLAGGPLAALRRDTWRRALLSANLARALAPARGLSSEEAYTAGLLHDLGEAVAMTCLEQMKLPVMPATAWRVLVARLHVEVGALLASRWGLPLSIATVIAEHHAREVDGIEQPLVALVALVDRVIAILDRAPESGVAALLELEGLDDGERSAVAGVVASVTRQMTAFESAAHHRSPSLPSEAPAVEGWAADFAITYRDRKYRAMRASPGELTFLGEGPLPSNWLVEIALHYHPQPFEMLVNVVRCEPGPGRRHAIVARPFALDGDPKAAWSRMLEELGQRAPTPISETEPPSVTA